MDYGQFNSFQSSDIRFSDIDAPQQHLFGSIDPATMDDMFREDPMGWATASATGQQSAYCAPFPPPVYGDINTPRGPERGKKGKGEHEKELVCDYANCGHAGKSFSQNRKDSLIRHLRGQHGEAIPKRGYDLTEDERDKLRDAGFWRCPKCVRRNPVGEMRQDDQRWRRCPVEGCKGKCGEIMDSPVSEGSQNELPAEGEGHDAGPAQEEGESLAGASPTAFAFLDGPDLKEGERTIFDLADCDAGQQQLSHWPNSF